MSFDPYLAEIRFGMGLSPVQLPVASVEDMVERLRGEDRAALDFPIPGSGDVAPSYADLIALRHAENDTRGTPGAAEAVAAYREARDETQRAVGRMAQASLLRAAQSEDALRERLVRFWADHFTIRSRRSLTRHLVTPFVETAIRPHVTGRFSDMLAATITHPMMLDYLDQRFSMGPESPAAQRRDRGLNENLARELLELHTIGVDGPYDQVDVRELSELLTGLSFHPQRGMEYYPQYAEPGAETVLGYTFSDEPRLDAVLEALDYLAHHPSTGRHLATKLAQHFVSDVPDSELIDAMAQTFTASGGDLLLVVDVMLKHPGAWGAERRKVKPPFDFIASALRGLDVPATRILDLDLRNARRYLSRPMAAMGQPWEEPPGPDGWPETAAEWVTPQGMAARFSWGLTVPQVALDSLPDPRDFAQTVLGPDVPGDVAFAAASAEDRADGIGIILASPAFQRR